MKNSFCVLLAAVIVASCSSVPENFVKVDGGTFMKGWTEKERALYKVNYGKDEDPLAPKEMSVETFYISKYEVTVGLWYEVMGYIPEKITYAEWSKEPDCPIMGITWLEAGVCCPWRKAK